MGLVHWVVLCRTLASNMGRIICHLTIAGRCQRVSMERPGIIIGNRLDGVTRSERFQRQSDRTFEGSPWRIGSQTTSPGRLRQACLLEGEPGSR